MEDLFYKLGLMTQKNNAELIQAIQNLQLSIEDFKNKFSTAQNLNSKNFSDLADVINFNHAEMKNIFTESEKNNVGKLNSVVDEISNLKKDLHALNSDLNKKIDIFNNNVNSNHAEMKNIFIESEKNNVGKLNFVVDEISNLKKDLHALNSDLNKKIDIFINNVNSNYAEIINLLTKIEKNNLDKNNSLGKGIADLKSKIENTAVETNKKFDTVTELTNLNYSALNNRLTKIEENNLAANNSFINDISNLKDKIENTFAKKETLGTILDDLDELKRISDTSAVEELLKLISANQIMNLIDKEPKQKKFIGTKLTP